MLSRSLWSADCRARRPTSRDDNPSGGRRCPLWTSPDCGWAHPSASGAGGDQRSHTSTHPSPFLSLAHTHSITLSKKSREENLGMVAGLSTIGPRGEPNVCLQRVPFGVPHVHPLAEANICQRSAKATLRDALRAFRLRVRASEGPSQLCLHELLASGLTRVHHGRACWGRIRRHPTQSRPVAHPSDSAGPLLGRGPTLAGGQPDLGARAAWSLVAPSQDSLRATGRACHDRK